jgi:hypothetical protein
MSDKREQKRCLLCGRMFGRKTSAAGNVENSTQFAGRWFCSRACAATARERRKKLASFEVCA